MDVATNNDEHMHGINGEHDGTVVVLNGDGDEHNGAVNGEDNEERIDIDGAQPESDTRHEQLAVNDASFDDQVGVTMDSNHTNGIHPRSPTEHETPTTTPAATATDITSTFTTPALEDDDQPPPAKRPRVHSDADKSSVVNTSATPPPPSTATTPVPSSPPSFDARQWKFCQSTIRTLKKLKDASPFLRPVDPVILNIPHYPSIIKNPMDFSTIERKLNSSNPSKPDPNPDNPRYANPDEFISDVRLIFQNCLTFNGPEHAISHMGKRVEEVFDKQIKQLPPPEAVVKKLSHSPSPPATAFSAKKSQSQRRASTSVPVIRRSDTEVAVGRPKREIHPPPPKDLLYTDLPKKIRKSKRVKDDGTSEQLKFCSKLLQEMHRKQHYSMASPFYEPVDWVKLDLPTYPKVVKKPMDLSTMKRKLDNHEYPSVEKFYEDFKLMIRNCFNFNPAGTPVNQAGIELQRFFDERWKSLPSAIVRDVSDDDDDEEEDNSDEERARTIALMESQIETMKGNIAALKSKPKEKKKKEKRDRALSTSKVGGQPAKSSKKKSKKTEDDVFTFDQKKDLSDAIGQLDGAKLEKVIQIIHEGVPEIRDSTEEIELEIDLLPPKVLTKLYNLVIRPLRPPTTKRSRPGKGGTGGLKRKSMDEDVEAEKIRQLEQRMKLFEQGNSGGYPPAVAGSDHSSDSSSGSDSSGSESD